MLSAEVCANRRPLRVAPVVSLFMLATIGSTINDLTETVLEKAIEIVLNGKNKSLFVLPHKELDFTYLPPLTAYHSAYGSGVKVSENHFFTLSEDRPSRPIYTEARGTHH